MGRELSVAGEPHPSHPSYQAALDFLIQRTTGKDRLGLDRTREVLRVMGDPHLRLRSFHVAGTNGKGSTVATLAALLRAKGLSVGVYSSPHLVDFTERILVNGAPVPPGEVVDFVERWTPEIERIGASFFEATTAFAFDWLARSAVDAAVIEVGLGGRLDSTNVITPLVAAVTSIGLDHTEYLGDTRELIAGEKAGIFKPGVPATIGEPDVEIRSLLAAQATANGASVARVLDDECRISDVEVGADGTSWTLTQRGGASARLRTALAGGHQARNASLALLTLDAAGPEWSVPLGEAGKALATVGLPGRFQTHGKYIFDVAHNADGMAVLVQTMGLVKPAAPVVALLNVLTDKDWRAMMEVLSRCVDHFVLTRSPSSPESRAWNPAEALAHAAERGWSATLEPDFGRALGAAAAAGATVLVTGSFHTVGDAMLALQVSPLAR